MIYVTVYYMHLIVQTDCVIHPRFAQTDIPNFFSVQLLLLRFHILYRKKRKKRNENPP